MLYILFLSKLLSLWYATLYQSSILDFFITLDHDWDSGDKVLKLDKTNIFYKSTIKNIIYDIFELTRIYIYMICLDLYRQKNLFFMMLFLLKLTLISFVLNIVLFFCFLFFFDDKNGDNSIYLYLLKLGYWTNIFYYLI